MDSIVDHSSCSAMDSGEEDFMVDTYYCLIILCDIIFISIVCCLQVV